jgi:hypothetical protein
MGEAIPVEDDGAVRHLVLGRPDEFNTITLAFRNELDAALDAADRDDDVRVVLLRADGKAFCAGFGLDWSTVSQASNDGARGRVWDSVADVRMIGLFGNTFAKLHSTSSGPWPMRPRWRGGSRVAAWRAPRRRASATSQWSISLAASRACVAFHSAGLRLSRTAA